MGLEFPGGVWGVCVTGCNMAVRGRGVKEHAPSSIPCLRIETPNPSSLHLVDSIQA